MWFSFQNKRPSVELTFSFSRNYSSTCAQTPLPHSSKVKKTKENHHSVTKKTEPTVKKKCAKTKSVSVHHVVICYKEDFRLFSLKV